MFLLFSPFAIIGICLAVVCLGVFFAPGYRIVQAVGGIAVVGGIGLVFYAPGGGVSIIALGVALVMAGTRWCSYVEEKEAQALQADARRLSRDMAPYFPDDLP